jgi:hypothetical protein
LRRLFVAYLSRMSCGVHAQLEKDWKRLVEQQVGALTTSHDRPTVVLYSQMVEHREVCEVCRDEDMVRGMDGAQEKPSSSLTGPGTSGILWRSGLKSHAPEPSVPEGQTAATSVFTVARQKFAFLEGCVAAPLLTLTEIAAPIDVNTSAIDVARFC